MCLFHINFENFIQMKKLTHLFTLLFMCSMLVGIQQAEAQDYNKRVKKREVRAGKMARKEARRFKKAGWKVLPGSLPMQKLLDRSWRKQLTQDNEGKASYIWAAGNGVAGSQAAADMQAMEVAKLQLAGQLESNLTAIAKTSIANNQRTKSKAETLTKVVTAAKNTIITRLRRVEPTYKIYREVTEEIRRKKRKRGIKVKNGNIEVQVMLFYNKKEATAIVEEEVKKALKDEVDDVHKEVNDLKKND